MDSKKTPILPRKLYLRFFWEVTVAPILREMLTACGEGKEKCMVAWKPAVLAGFQVMVLTPLLLVGLQP